MNCLYNYTYNTVFPMNDLNTLNKMLTIKFELMIDWYTSKGQISNTTDSCHGRVSRINKICIRSSSYCRSQATTA